MQSLKHDTAHEIIGKQPYKFFFYMLIHMPLFLLHMHIHRIFKSYMHIHMICAYAFSNTDWQYSFSHSASSTFYHLNKEIWTNETLTIFVCQFLSVTSNKFSKKTKKGSQLFKCLFLSGTRLAFKIPWRPN